MKVFYLAIGAIAVAGIGALAYTMTRPVSVEIPADVLIQATDTAGFSGYYLGSAEALVETAAKCRARFVPHALSSFSDSSGSRIAYARFSA